MFKSILLIPNPCSHRILYCYYISKDLVVIKEQIKFQSSLAASFIISLEKMLRNSFQLNNIIYRGKKSFDSYYLIILQIS